MPAQVDDDAGVVTGLRREGREPASPGVDKLGREREFVRRVHVEKVFRRHDDLAQAVPAGLGVERLEEGTGRVERVAVRGPADLQ